MDSIDQLFESPNALVDRARDHAREAREVVDTFFARNPYAEVIDIDPDTGQKIHKVRLTAKIPGKVTAIVKDATSNLRDALDHAVFASTVALTGVSDPADTGFPFARDAAGVHGELYKSRRLSGNAAEIRPLLASFEPHEAGNQLLVGLNRLRNPNTHRVLVPMATASVLMEGALNMVSKTGGMRFGYSTWDAAKNEVEFMRIDPHEQPDYKVKIAFYVTFGDIPFLGGQELMNGLHALTTEVERIVLAVKAETARALRERT